MKVLPQARWSFEKVGLSYRLWAEEAGVEMFLGRLKRTGQELQGELRILVDWEDIKTVNGSLHQARFNVSSVAARGTLAKHLRTRTDNTPFEKMDWGDALEHLCQFVLEAERTGEPIISMNGPMPTEHRIRWDIDPICPSGDVAWLYGPGGMGKSIVALGLALSIAKGMEIIPRLAPQVKGPVLYLDWETKPHTVRERIEHIANGHHFKATKDFYYRRCTRTLHDEAEEISRVVSEKGIKFMVVDSCGLAQGGTGERGDANEATLRLFEAIRLIGVSTLVVDHVAKQEMRDHKGKVVGALPYGSIYKVNLARATWELQSGIADDADVHLRLVQTKANDSPRRDPILVRVQWDTSAGVIRFEEDSAFQPADYVEEREIKGGLKGRMIELLHGRPDGLTATDMAKALDSTERSIGNRIRENLDIFEVIYGSNPPRYHLIKPGAIR